MSTSDDIRRRFLGLVLGGRYRLDDLIGHGGMGAVFRATDERLGRQVAVKVLWEDDLPAPRRARFVREARLPGHIRDANVVVVHDLDTHVDAESGRALDFIVMELLRGDDLAAWLRRRTAIDLDEAAEILVQAARGVAAAHRRGIVHRDVKPRNLVVADGESGRPEVTVVDFGIAKSLTTADEFGDLTIGPGFMGSARYSSPEQLHGREEPGPRSDVFSLGVIAYELFTGSLPFSDDERARLSQGLPVSLVAPSNRNPAIPPALEEVVLRCLDLDPAARYVDARELADAVVHARTSIVPQPAAVVDAGTFPPAEHTEIDATILHAGDEGAAESGAEVENPRPVRERRRKVRLRGSRAPSQSPGSAAIPVDAAGLVAAPAPSGGPPVDAAPDASPSSEDRRRNPTQPRPPRWVPGKRAYAAVMAIAALVLVAGMVDMQTSGGLVHAFRKMFFGAREIRPGQAIIGELEEGDSVAGGKRFDVYRYRGEVGEPLTFTLDSAGFDGDLEWGHVVNGAWKTLESSGLHPAQLHVTVNDTSEYLLRVRAARQGARGRYRVMPVRGTPAISAGQMVRSRLTAADATLAGGVWGEEWIVRAQPGEQITATVHPEGFAARVQWRHLEGGQWERLEEGLSDDAGKDAALTVTATDGGEYRVRVQNRVDRDAGFYTLQVATGARELQAGAQVTSRLTRADADAAGGAPAETWTYRGAPGDAVAITLRSSARLLLEWGRVANGQWQPLTSVASADTPVTLRLRPPADASYGLRIHGAVPSDTGRYQLSAAVQRTAGTVRIGETAYGALGPDDPMADGKYYQEWSLGGTPGENVMIAVRSGVIDPVVSFGCWTTDGLWQEIARNDDVSGFDRSAVVDTHVAGSGACVIRASSYYAPYTSGPYGGTGGYELSVRGYQELVPPQEPPREIPRLP